MNNTKFTVHESKLLREKYYSMTHDSGLEIFVFPKKLSSTYAIIGTRYGSIDNTFHLEGEDKVTKVPDGIAHFLEHKLFTNEDGSDSFERFSAYGADANAYTSFNKTAYLFCCTDNLEPSLRELIEFVTHPYFTDESVKKEIGIIAQEIKMYDDSPAEACYVGMLEGLYEKHGIRRNICGSVRSISKITPELLYECYRVFYDLSNMSLVVCGDVTPEEISEIVDPLLPKAKTGIKPISLSRRVLESQSVFMPRVSKRMQVSKPIFNIGIKDTDVPKDPYERLRKDAGMSILNEMLFSRAGELYSDLFESGTIDPEMSYCYTINESFAFNSIAGEANDPEAVLGKIKDYINEKKNNGLSMADFERGRRVMYAEFVKEFDSTESIANSLLSFVFEGADIFSFAEIVLNVSFEDVKRLFDSAFKDEYFTLSVVYPLSDDNEKNEDNGGVL